MNNFDHLVGLMVIKYYPETRVRYFLERKYHLNGIGRDIVSLLLFVELFEFGCYGGLTYHAYEYCVANNISTSLDYPYRGR
ncbi:LOW QUALITY PROTEIN: hypothetical protein MXB_4931, partial [Myxobolus squamalis]